MIRSEAARRALKVLADHGIPAPTSRDTCLANDAMSSRAKGLSRTHALRDNRLDPSGEDLATSPGKAVDQRVEYDRSASLHVAFTGRVVTQDISTASQRPHQRDRRVMWVKSHRDREPPQALVGQEPTELRSLGCLPDELREFVLMENLRMAWLIGDP